MLAEHCDILINLEFSALNPASETSRLAGSGKNVD